MTFYLKLIGLKSEKNRRSKKGVKSFLPPPEAPRPNFALQALADIFFNMSVRLNSIPAGGNWLPFFYLLKPGKLPIIGLSCCLLSAYFLIARQF